MPKARRAFLAQTLREVREGRQCGRLMDFSFQDPGVPGAVVRYGSGSLGGKGRGLAFFNSLLYAALSEERFSPITVEIPRTLIIATGEFDKFMERGNWPIEFVPEDSELRRAFLSAPLPKGLVRVLENVH